MPIPDLKLTFYSPPPPQLPSRPSAWLGARAKTIETSLPLAYSNAIETCCIPKIYLRYGMG